MTNTRFMRLRKRWSGESVGTNGVDQLEKPEEAHVVLLWRAVPRADAATVPRPRVGHSLTFQEDTRTVLLFGGWCVSIY